ncbi:acyl-CoA thioesterase [Leptospira ilyithenensis]|uniref:Acyl-CoA thioesterase n=2 Tax=Leptospira ilyithenensis TaxID=2484901 RepID=A0A4R9LW17_9LEPT|nr:acyl-CoA thioesterase [Leptospira ilyithenensis]
MKTYETMKAVRFQHCDPAGVVFTPQYFNLFMEVVEDWFAHLGYGFSKIVIKEHQGIPAMRIIAKFFKPSFLGDQLQFVLNVKRLREKNVLVNVTAFCDQERRCTTEFLFGFAALSSLSLVEWPEGLREGMSEYLQGR